MAEIIDFAAIPRRDCSNCLWHDFERGACLRPGGYNYDWKLNRCYSFQWKNGNPIKKEGANRE